MDRSITPAIKSLDLDAEHAPLREALLARIGEVVRSGTYVLGPWLRRFETEAASWLGARHAVGVASGTDALWLALRALDIGPGDEVITTPFTFFANVEAIRRAGARAVFADVDPQTWNLDPRAVAAAITPRTRAILPVHLFGLPADLPALLALAERHRLAVVEDCAQALGARLEDRAVGNFGTLGCYSFYPTKPLGALGDGGMLVTGDTALAERLRRLRNHGGTRAHEHLEDGWNSRLDEIQAAALSLKLEHLPAILRHRRKLAAVYRQGLAGTGLQLPAEPAKVEHAWAQFTVLGNDRDRLVRELRARGVPVAVHYPRPTYRQPACAADYPDLQLPVTEDLTRRCLSLPLHGGLRESDAGYVVEQLRACLG